MRFLAGSVLPLQARGGKLFRTVLMMAGVLGAAPVTAATFATNFNVGPNMGDQCAAIEVDGSTATCTVGTLLTGLQADLDLRARQDNGNIGLSANLRVTGTGDPDTRGQLFTSRVAVTFADTLTFAGIDDGVFVVPLDLAGSSFAPAPSTSPNFVGVIGYSATDVDVQRSFRTASGGFDGDVLYREERSGTTFINSPADNSLGELQGSLGVQNLLFPIIDGKSEFSISIGAGVTCFGTLTAANPCQASVDFLNSARLLGASVQDLDGRDVAGISIFSDSGFDYLTGAQPHDPSPVPLPATGVMLVAGIMALGATARRRKTTARA